MPGISAVLIVRNEADRLAECLRALQGVVDEIVVADTGSTDDTLAIAREFTPHCHRIAWEDDFAAARNQAIAYAAGPWILSIDADEVVEDPEAARARLEAFIQFQPTGTTGTIRHRSPTGTGGGHTVVQGDVERFFPKDHYTYRGIIHEHLAPVAGIHPGAANTGVIIRHSGYAHTENDPDHKGRRNLPLLEQAVAADPENEYYHYQLGKTLFALKRYDRAIVSFEEAIARIQFDREHPTTHDGTPIGREMLTTLVTSLAYAYANTARLQDAEALLSEHRTLGHVGTRWADFYHACGYIALMQGDVERARAGYTESMRCGPSREDVAGTGSYASAYHLGLLAEATQDPIEAINEYSTALQLKPDYQVVLDRIIDFMVENQSGVAPGIQAHADPQAFAATCLRKVKAYLDQDEKEKVDFIITSIGHLHQTNKGFVGDLLEQCQAIRTRYGIA